MTAPLSSTARLLGFAGLLPQIAFVGLQFVHPDPGWTLLAFAYGALILSFLGGIWWGMAVAGRGPDTGLLALSVAPTLVGMALLVGVLLQTTIRWPLVLLGSAIMLTLLVDRHLMNRGDAPPDWMRLRTPLSLGLGALTILAGVV